MMRILVLSDNHGKWKRVYDILEQFKDQVDYIFHCGDSEFDGNDPIWVYFDAAVRGNMDRNDFPLSEEVKTEKVKIFMTHGHLNKVNHSLEDLYRLGKEHQAEIVLFGHTHRLAALNINDILFVNPGSLNDARGDVPYLTFSIINLSDEEIVVDYYTEKMNIIAEYTQKFIRNKECNM